MGLFNFWSPDKRLRKIAGSINALESEVRGFSNENLKIESEKLRGRIKAGESLEAILPRAFALVRETARRNLGQRHYDVQLMGGVALAEGKIAEMRTGEGKTLSATAPTYLHALVGRGVHIVTVNEYLAKRDTVWMGQIYHALGLKVACLIHDGALVYDPDYKIWATEDRGQMSGAQKTDPSDLGHPSSDNHGESVLLDKERDLTGVFRVQDAYLRPITRREAYAADITYGTNHEFGFDYLRDNLAYRKEDRVQRDFYYALIDEVDSILIDEARTPLIISAPDAESSDYYKTFARIASHLEKETDYIADEKHNSVSITESGIEKVEKTLNIKNIYSIENSRLTHYLEESLKASALYTRDKDYVVKDGEIIIVDQFTGRLMHGRRYSGGLHQAIEAKEGVKVQQESRTYAQISIQNYFRLYEKLAGMTGTAQTSAEEFDKVYGLEVVTIPTNKPLIRKDEPDLIYKTAAGKFMAVVEEIKSRHKKGQPVLVGTVSIEKNEMLSKLLSHAGVPHEVLNAKNNEREGAIIAQAGRVRAVTVATNMAGRGVDIMLGGVAPSKFKIQNSKLKINEELSELTEEYKKWEEDRRRVIEAGGLHVLGTERHEARRIDNQLRGRAARQGDIGSSQFFLSLEDDLMRVFGGDRLKNMMETLKIPEDMPISSRLVSRAITEAQSRVEGLHFDSRKHLLEYDDVLNKQRLNIYKKRTALLEAGSHPQILAYLDMLWMNHLSDMESLSDAVRLRAYGQHDPLVEYKKDGHEMFQALSANFEEWYAENAERFQLIANRESQNVNGQNSNAQNPSGYRPAGGLVANNYPKVGRNDPCPCNSGKKYKKCHGV